MLSSSALIVDCCGLLYYKNKIKCEYVLSTIIHRIPKTDGLLPSYEDRLLLFLDNVPAPGGLDSVKAFSFGHRNGTYIQSSLKEKDLCCLFLPANDD